MERPRPVVDGVNAPFFEALAEGRLSLQRCDACGSFVYYPRATCPECLSTELTWTPASGRGRLASFAEVHKPQHPAFNEEAPITLVAVELDEGPVAFGRLPGVQLAELRIGAAVELDAEATRARAELLFFRPMQ
jgi:uncharacterized OB-fold protein